MDKHELDIIQQLMEVLQDKMQHGEDDLSERLGRKKPGIEVVKVEGKLPMGDDPMKEADAAAAMAPGDDREMSEVPEHHSMSMGDDMMDESPEEKLKRRLMKMRG